MFVLYYSVASSVRNVYITSLYVYISKTISIYNIRKKSENWKEIHNHNEKKKQTNIKEKDENATVDISVFI